MSANIDVKFLLIFKFANHRTKEPFTLIVNDHLGDWSPENKMSPQDSNHPDDLLQSRYVNPGFKLFTYKRTLCFTRHKALVGILIAIGDVIDTFAIANIFPMEM